MQDQCWKPLPAKPCGMLDSIMVTGQAMALATSCVCTSVGISSTLPQGSPSSEHGRSFHSYGNDQDPQRCCDYPRLPSWWKVMLCGLSEKCWQLGHSCCLPGKWKGPRERTGRDSAEIKARVNLVCKVDNDMVGKCCQRCPGIPSYLLFQRAC